MKTQVAILMVAILASGCAAKQGYSTKASVSSKNEAIMTKEEFDAKLTGYNPNVPPRTTTIEQRAQTGLEAYVAGNYSLARSLLTSALNGDLDDVEDATIHQWIDTMIAMDWEQKKDIRLLNAVDNHAFLTAKDKQFWWCRVLERRGHLYEAKGCWSSLGEGDRARRVILSKEYRDALINPYQQIGTR